MYFKYSCHHARNLPPPAWVADTRFYVVFEIVSLAHMLSSWIVKTLLSIFIHRAQSSTKLPPSNTRRLLRRWKQSSSKSLIVIIIYPSWQDENTPLPLFNMLALWKTWWCVWTHIAIMEFQCKGQASDESVLQLHFMNSGELESNGGSVFIWNIILVGYPWLWRGC